MNPTTNTEAGAVADVVAIARGLTKAQRSFLLEDRHSFASGYKPGEKLVALTLLDRRRLNFGQVVKITPLGLAVRQHLEQGATANG